MTHDRFYRHGSRIEWIYHNPDSVAGGQFVLNYFDEEDVAAALAQCDISTPDGVEEFFDFIGGRCRQYLIDNGTSEYDAEAKHTTDYDPDLLATDYSRETIDEIARYFGARICTRCGRLHYEGYYVEALEYYCSDECLHAFYEPDTYEEMLEADEAFWTQWWEG